MTIDPTVGVDSMAHGGEAVGRTGGKAIFVTGGVPGDVAVVRVTSDRKSYSRGSADRLIAASPDRIEPPCPVFEQCGGCDWQMMELSAQRRWKADIVRGQLAHVGRMPDVLVEDTMAVGPGFGYRNRIDLRISHGRPALFAAGSHTPVQIEQCLLVSEPIARRISGLAPEPDLERLTIRASQATGQVAELRRRAGRWERGRITEVVAGRSLRVSDRGFFQVNTAGAEALVELVGGHLQVGSSDVLLDGYAGGGLFSATAGSDAAEVVAVENDRQALADLRFNAPWARVVAARFEAAGLPPVDAAVVDPPRSGLGKAGVASLLRARPGRLAYVSCDAAALARDLALLKAAGFTVERVVPVDMFPNTHHIEAVALLTR